MPEQHAFEPEDIPLNCIYEDDHLLVFNKAAGMVMHPAAGNWTGTVLNGLLFHYPELAQLPRAGIVHRLDKDTSGLFVVARTALAQTAWCDSCKIIWLSGAIWPGCGVIPHYTERSMLP